MPATASRAVLRQSQFLTRRTAVRYASSTPESAQKAGEAASSAASKASEGLSRVTSTAGPALSNAAQGVGSALRKVGGRTGKVIAFVDLGAVVINAIVATTPASMIPPTLYYGKVGLELAKLVFRGQNMTPPNLATFQSFYQPLLNAFRSPAALKNANFVSPGDIAARVRNANKKEIALAGVTLAEIIGFFTVGEMIGRMNIVGYRGHPEHHGDH
ncbi:mitochondrial ATP synthase g subunit-domain-containing protein [Aspergillus pseudotamarii]|uniref:Mitochondrial ATP synthase g subunit-domain-containing protein n=1 Tax=Aspergillus pseudotamarii TaxID=132259 RepID=A0A5N6T882_ASPPS|nr:mitochondrial ATP synthase g subunit-domain-containing protein [Aspergillus pseudotamarii]KAE8142565.1 mitochondrial ATP synthase g subunit-domain-containing protein [Aspergillus pseudotamarii]